MFNKPRTREGRENWVHRVIKKPVSGDLKKKAARVQQKERFGTRRRATWKGEREKKVRKQSEASASGLTSWPKLIGWERTTRIGGGGGLKKPHGRRRQKAGGSRLGTGGNKVS